MYEEVLEKLKKAYGQVLHRIGDALDDNTLIGPLHSETSLKNYLETIDKIVKAGGTIEFGGKVIIFWFIIELVTKLKFSENKQKWLLRRTNDSNRVKTRPPFSP